MRKAVFWTVAGVAVFWMLGSLQYSGRTPTEILGESCARDRDENIRHFQTILDTIHRGATGGQTGAGAQAVVEDLCRTGTDAAEAKRAVDTVLLSPSINPAAVGQITNLARNIAA